MALYIIYVEPLLLPLERKLVGITLLSMKKNQTLVKEVLEAYCDDINVMISDLNDFAKLSQTVVAFEQYSGAILSRNFKCKVVGLGKWNG